MEITKISQIGLDLIKNYEGFSSKPYLCSAGIPTIGYGATYYPNGKKVTMQDPAITEEWAETMLSKMIVFYEQNVSSMVTNVLTQHQFDALVSFTYNCGVQNVRKSTLLRYVNNNPNDPAIAEQFARWVRVKGKVVKGLVKRRQAECQLYFS
jgi:lysozyme